MKTKFYPHDGFIGITRNSLLTKMLQYAYVREEQERNNFHSSVRLREFAEKILFCRKLHNRQWKMIRLLAFRVVDTYWCISSRLNPNKRFINVKRTDASAIALVCGFMTRYKTQFPSMNNEYKLREIYNQIIEHIEEFDLEDNKDKEFCKIPYPCEETTVRKSIAVNTPWFYGNKKAKVRYWTVAELIKLTFGGYAPTPQYFGKLFSKPKSRNYTLNDFIWIRDKIKESLDSRKLRYIFTELDGLFNDLIPVTVNDVALSVR
jgi:hypothetical protein